MSLWLINGILVVAYMSVWFAVGKRRNRLDAADTAWGGGFIVIAVATFLFHPTILTAIILALVLAWGLRLARHIHARHAGQAPDPRYVELSAKWRPSTFWLRAYVSVFLTQAVLIYLVALPITLAGSTSGQNPLLIAVGLLLWLVGFVFETTGDRQLRRFLSDTSNRGKVMQSGLWRYSRHPNYFGEMTLWIGITVIAVGGGSGWLALIGPVVITWLLLFVSGIPPLERRYQTNAAYQEYASRTSMFIPLPPKRPQPAS